jgi:outer membrane protein assembly factor BamB
MQPSVPWRLVTRTPLLKKVDGEGPGLFLTVGPRAIAIEAMAELRLVLNREDLSLRWEGRLPRGTLVAGWCDANHLLLHLNRATGVWSLDSGSIVWRASGKGTVWQEQVLILGEPGRLDIRAIRTGSITRSKPLEIGKAQSMQVVENVLVVDKGGSLDGIELPTAEHKWTAFLEKEFPGLARGRPIYADVFPGSTGHAIVKYDTGLGQLDLGSGAMRWKSQVPTDHMPLVSPERIGFFYNGNLVVLDEATGAQIAAVENAAETLWEARPCVHGGWMVVVDERGHIVTVAMSDGKLVGVQKEKGIGFRGCASVDGRLLVGGLDGALWVYEPAQQTPSRSEGRRKRPDVAKQSTPASLPRPARGNRSRGTRAPGSTKARRG